MKKILMFLLCLLIFASFPLQNSAHAETNKLRVVFPTIYAYSAKDINSDQTTIITSFKSGTILTKLQDDEPLGADGLEYYKIELAVDEYTFGYVLKSQVVAADVVSMQRELDSNATINQDTFVHNFVENNDGTTAYEPTQIALKKGERVRLVDGYADSQYLKVQYKDNSGELVYGYVLKDHIAVSPISRTAIGVVIIIVTTASLACLIFGIGKKKKKDKAKAE
ncbi:MAG: hypothetical protein E7378_04585 [Clostridiales bacterium]|nr:hypothetical protein [Clostridiales bacterium]